MAEIDQLRLRSAVASMSSFPVSMRAVPLLVASVWTPKASGGGPPSWWMVGPPESPRVGNVSEQVWGVLRERRQLWTIWLPPEPDGLADST